jgi:predicted permease
VTSVLHALRITIRQLRKAPVFTCVVVLTIALGMGANTAIFSVMNSVLLRRLPVPQPEQLVYFHLQNQPLNTSQTGYNDMSFSMPVFEEMRRRHDVLQGVIGFVPLAFSGKVPVRIDSQPEEARGEEVSGDFFSVLGVQPAVGRGFTLEDENAHSAIAVLSNAWWRRRFNGDRSVLGRTLYVRGQAITVVGIAPPGFDGADPEYPQMDFWIPLQNRPELNAWGTPATDHTLYGSRDWLALMILGRMQPGLSLEQAQARLQPALLAGLADSAPRDPRDQTPQLVLSAIRGVESLRENYEQPVRFLMGMVALLLLIACANVVMLLLARNSNRLPEFSLRRALGATRGKLFAQLFQETSLLVIAGAALGWIFAGAATQALSAWSGLNFEIAADNRVLTFTAAVSSLIALLFGLAPLFFVSRLQPNLALRSAHGTADGAERNRFFGRKAMVALQIALCVVLVSGGGLLYRTFRNLQASDLGMRTSGLLVFGVTPQPGIHTDADAVRFHQGLLARMRALPGVDSATLLQTRFGEGSSSNDGALVDGRTPQPYKRIAPMRVDTVGPDFLCTFGIPIHAGRDFQESDSATAAKVTIIDQTFAEKYFPGVNPVGHSIAFYSEPKVTYTVVGVAGNFRYSGVKEKARPMAFFPFTQQNGILGMQYELHTSRDPRLLISEAAAVLRNTDPDLLMEKPMTQRDQFDESVSQERLVARLSMFFAGLAVFLVAIGLYGTVSYAVNRRTMEFGVRMALGAQRSQVLRMVLLETSIVAAVGLAVGIPAAVAVSRTLRSMLFGLSPADPLTLGLAFVGISALALVTAFFPALRAASVDPMRALRME